MLRKYKVFKTNAWRIVFTVIKIITNYQIKDEINEWEKNESIGKTSFLLSFTEE